MRTPATIFMTITLMSMVHESPVAWSQQDSGWFDCAEKLQCHDIVVGTGPIAAAPLAVRVHKAEDSDYFDIGYHFGAPRPGLSNQEKAHRQAIVGMKVGGRRQVRDNGYWVKKIYEIELLDVAPTVVELQERNSTELKIQDFTPSTIQEAPAPTKPQQAQTSIVREAQNSGRYLGCTLSYPPANSSFTNPTISRGCLGHIFSNPKPDVPDDELKYCQLLEDKHGDFSIAGGCIVDGYRYDRTIKFQHGLNDNWNHYPIINTTPEEIAAQAIRAQKEIESRTTAKNTVKAAKYIELVTAARAQGKTYPTFLGILMGAPWIGVQDVNDCSQKNWNVGTPIPFCIYKTDEQRPPTGERWTTCVRIDDTKFDTSWVISPWADTEVEADNLGAAMVAFAFAAEKAKRCFVNVFILQDGSVGRVSIPTSLRSHDVEKLIDQLKAKYGNRFNSDKQQWTIGNPTFILQWALPGLTVKYNERTENNGGKAFNGGHLEINTSDWATAIEDEKRKNFKPAF